MTHDDRTQPLILPGFRDDMSDAFGPRRIHCENAHDEGHRHDWVARHIALGNEVATPAEVLGLTRVGITRVLDLRSMPCDPQLYGASGIAYLCLPSLDDGEPREYRWVADGVRFALAGLNAGGRVLVHCHKGIHRSPAMVYAILRARGMREQRALDAITRNRRMARPARYLASVNEALARLGYV